MVSQNLHCIYLKTTIPKYDSATEPFTVKMLRDTPDWKKQLQWAFLQFIFKVQALAYPIPVNHMQPLSHITFDPGCRR
jgi:hypothetical protein